MSGQKEEIEHFSAKDVVRASFGALLVALTFLFKGRLLDISLTLTESHLIAITLATLVILSAEIYSIGYMRVRFKKNRPFGQFLLKRLVTIYSISFLTVAFLIYLYNIDSAVGSNYNVFRTIVSVSFPAAIGAAIADILKKY